MRKLLLSAAAAYVLMAGVAPAWAVTANPASPKSDIENDAIIRKLYERFTVAWNQHEPATLAKMWVEDGDHVEPDGRVAKGRREIEKLFAAEHRSVFKQSHLTLSVDTVWFVTADVALVDGTYELSGARDPQGKELPARKGRLSSLFLKEGGKWLIAASRLMIPAPLPYRAES